MHFLTRFLALSLVLIAIPALAQTTRPTLSNPVGTPGANGSASLRVDVLTNGATTTVTFSYGLTTTYTNTATVSAPNNAAVQTVTAPLTNLVGAQTYHFQAAAVNSAGTAQATADQTFTVAAYAGRPTTGTATTVAGTATLNGTVTANGTAGKAYFEYGVTTAYGSDTQADMVTVAAGDIARAVRTSVPGLLRNTVYHFRLVFVDDATNTPVNGSDAQFTTNNAPVANADTVNSAGAGPTTINPLGNDRDVDGDALTVDSVVTQPTRGRATVAGNSIIYTPTQGAVAGFDTFTYRIRDAFGLTATGTINIRAIRAAFAGTHGGFVKRINGKEAGYFTVTATANGSFTGIALIEGKRYVISGTITPDGVYRGSAVNGASILPVFLFTDQTDTGSTVTALFGNGQWSSELSISPTEGATRGDLTGRYTVGLGGGGGTTTGGTGTSTGTSSDPEGTGWAAVRVRDDGTAGIKGRLPDGRSFSTRGTVNITDNVATLNFFDDPDGTRVVGSLTLGDAVGGTVQTDRGSSGEGRFPRGFNATASASGARYVMPEDSKRVLDTTSSKGQDLTIAFTGGGLRTALSLDIMLDDNDRVHVTSSSGEDLRLRIDRKSGRFQAKLSADDEATRIKATGVLIQPTRTTDANTGITTFSGSGRGVGIFNTSEGTGAVTISAGGSTGTTPTTGTPGTTPTTGITTTPP